MRAALIQAHANMSKSEALEKHVAMVEDATGQGAQVACLQEIFFGPYFCAQQEPKWFETAEPDDGPTVSAMRELARKHEVVLIVPFFEKEFEGVFYNTAVVIDADGNVCGKYRKTHIPQVGPIFWEKYFFKPGNLGYPVFETRVGKVGVFICYDRHFPEPARLLGLHGAQLTFNPSATIESVSRYLWELEQPAHAAANGFFVGAVNRVGEELVDGARFYGSSYFCDPRGQIIAQASETDDEVLVADLDLAMIDEVRTSWQFFRDRRPETYGELSALLP
ncbi:MAG TPA: nitrilase-related carbon-nitrogen hydrolase [Gaiellaceae bacterium]|nr:nitrilase-related carbon-nitrogen hydrolase [Gaiellaceae bacterium]